MKPIKLPFGLVLSKPKAKTALHPQYKTLTEFAFKIDGVEYYEFATLGDMPPERYKKMQDIMVQCDWRMTIDDIKELVKLQRDAVNKGKLTDVVEVIQGFEYCLGLYLETDLFMMLFSCVFFTLDEDLSDYDYDIGAKKIEAFKKHGIPDFFLKTPVKKWLPVTDISKQDIETFSKMTSVKRSYLLSLKQKVMKNINANA